MKAVGFEHFDRTRKLYGDSVSTLKQSISPQTFYACEQGEVKRPNGKGWAEAGLCPFHDDTRAGSFYVNMESGGFKCFSCKTSGGDVITYTMKRYGLSFIAAKLRLQIDWG